MEQYIQHHHHVNNKDNINDNQRKTSIILKTIRINLYFDMNKKDQVLMVYLDHHHIILAITIIPTATNACTVLRKSS